MQQLENELTQTQTNLETASHNLEEKEKALQNVSVAWLITFTHNLNHLPQSLRLK